MSFRCVKAYAIKAKVPKNSQAYFNYFKKEVIKKCVDKNVGCIIEILDGRILLFTDCNDVKALLESVKGILSYYEVEIFEDINSLVERIAIEMKGCESFAVRSNKKALEREIGGKIAEILNISVDLSNPQCISYFERRGKFYLLFLSYP